RRASLAPEVDRAPHCALDRLVVRERTARLDRRGAAGALTRAARGTPRRSLVGPRAAPYPSRPRGRRGTVGRGLRRGDRAGRPRVGRRAALVDDGGRPRLRLLRRLPASPPADLGAEPRPGP